MNAFSKIHIIFQRFIIIENCHKAEKLSVCRIENCQKKLSEETVRAKPWFTTSLSVRRTQHSRLNHRILYNIHCVNSSGTLLDFVLNYNKNLKRYPFLNLFERRGNDEKSFGLEALVFTSVEDNLSVDNRISFYSNNHIVAQSHSHSGCPTS